jgi:hypothetical protein
MANKRIEIDVLVDDKGTMGKVGLGAKKAGDNLDAMARGARDAERNTKGAAQASSNGTKNFSKMAQGAGGLVAAYATLAANIFAISAAYSFLKKAGDLVALTKGQEAYANRTGKSMKLLTSRIQDATGGLLAFNEASQAAAIGTAAGLSSDQLTGLAKLAKNASVALGRDLTDSFNRLTKGAIKAEPELLDELGIILRLEKASNDYARVLGKNADELTTFEKSQGIVNAVLEQGNEKFKDVGDNVNNVAKLGKAFDDLVKKLMKFIEPAAGFMATVFVTNVEALAAAFGLLGLSITRALAPAAPAMASIASMADHSRAALMGAAGSGVRGQKIAGGDFSSGNLNAIDKGAGLKSGNSTVIDQMKMTEREAKKHTAVIRADHARMVAANTRGFGSYSANFIAYLRGMEAEHGKTMGRIKAAGALMASGLGKVLNAVAIVGMISLAITFLKEFIEYLKDPAIKRMEANAKSLAQEYAAQNEEISKMIANLEMTSKPVEALVQQGNMLSNLTFPAVKQMADSLKKSVMDAKTTSTLAMNAGPNGLSFGASEPTTMISYTDNEEVKANLTAMDSITESLQVQLGLLDEYNIKNEVTMRQRLRVYHIEKDLAIIKKGETQGSNTQDVKAAEANLKVYNDAVGRMSKNLINARSDAVNLNTVLSPSQAAIRDIGEASKAFKVFRAGLKKTNSSYTTFIEFGEKFDEQLKTLEGNVGKQSLGAFFDDTKLSAFEEFLGIQTEGEKKAFRALTVAQAREKIENKIGEVKKRENSVALTALQTEKEHLESLKGKSKVEKDILNAKNKSKKLDDQIKQIQDKIDHEKDNLKLTDDDTTIKVQQKKIEGLKAQKVLEDEIADKLQNQSDYSTNLFNLAVSGELRKAKEEVLAVKEKELAIEEKMLALSEKERERDANRKKRDFKKSSPFSYLGQAKFDAAEDLKLAKDSLEGRLAFIEKEKKIKKELIEMEYILLGAKLDFLEQELKAKSQDSVTYTNKKDRDRFAASAQDVAGLRGKLEGMKSREKTFIDMQAESAIQDVLDNITRLEDAKEALTDVQVLTDGIAQSLESGMTSAFTSLVTGTKSAKQAFASMAKSIISMIAQMIIKMMVFRLISSFIPGSAGGVASDPSAGMTDISSSWTAVIPNTARNGGIFSEGKKVQGYSTGGVAKGSTSGYPAVLHGTEAVVPLPNGRAIPVEMKGSGSTNNNIVVNISTDGQTSKNNSTGPDMDKLGSAVAQAVQVELQNQKRSGGILNPYGAA